MSAGKGRLLEKVYSSMLDIARERPFLPVPALFKIFLNQRVTSLKTEKQFVPDVVREKKYTSEGSFLSKASVWGRDFLPEIALASMA